MSVEFSLVDPSTGMTAKVGLDNALAVSPSQSSKTHNATLDVDATPVEIVAAKGGFIFCITGIILTGNKGISTSVDALVDIYTSTDSASATAVTTILSIPIARSSQTVITGVLLETEAGHFINGKTSDDDVLVTILGFYVG